MSAGFIIIYAVVRALVSIVGIYIYIINIIILSCPRVGLPRHCRLSAGFRSFSVFSMFFVSMPQPFLCSLSACSRNCGCEFFHSCGTMSVSEGTQPETTLQYLCKFCGMLYPESEGRLHGKTFVCTPCGNHDRALRRNLGQQSELGTFSPEESKDFFRKLLQRRQESSTAGGRLSWTTVRAVMITSLTERAIMSYRGDVECTELPLSVYASKGWPEEVVKKCESVWSDDYGVWCYKVPIRKQTWSQTYERIESKVLQQEQEASKKNTNARRKKKTGTCQLRLTPARALRRSRTPSEKLLQPRRFTRRITRLPRPLPTQLGLWRKRNPL